MIRDLLPKQRKKHDKKPGIPPRLSDLLKGRFSPMYYPTFMGVTGRIIFLSDNIGEVLVRLRGIRTLDTWFRRPVLYPLSYRRLTSVIIAYGEKIRKGKRCLAFARQEDTKQIPLSSSAGSFKTIFLQILSGYASGRT